MDEQPHVYILNPLIFNEPKRLYFDNPNEPYDWLAIPRHWLG